MGTDCAECINIVHAQVQTPCGHIFYKSCVAQCLLPLADCIKPIVRMMNSMTVRCPNESGAVMLSVTGVRWTRVAGGGVDYTLNVFVHVGTDGLHGFFQRDWQYSRFVLGSAPRARLGRP